jgi:hypothetical protein
MEIYKYTPRCYCYLPVHQIYIQGPTSYRNYKYTLNPLYYTYHNKDTLFTLNLVSSFLITWLSHSNPTTALNAGRWAGCAQVKSMACHWHTGQVSWHHGKPACFHGGASYHRILCASGVQSNHGTARVGNDGLLQESRGVRCHSARGGDGAAGQRSSYAWQRVLAQQW